MRKQLDDIEEVDQLISLISRFFIKNHPFLKGDDINPKQFFLLRTLHAKKKSTVSELAQELGISTSATTIALNRLVDASFVNRTRDQEDRRIVWVELSEKADKLIQNMVKRRKQLMQKLLNNLTVEESEELIRLFRKISTNLETGCLYE